jgi:hypothetical protein
MVDHGNGIPLFPENIRVFEGLPERIPNTDRTHNPYLRIAQNLEIQNGLSTQVDVAVGLVTKRRTSPFIHFSKMPPIKQWAWPTTRSLVCNV